MDSGNVNHTAIFSKTKILFIAYVNRSGSTLLLNELSKVSKFTCLPESELLAKKLLQKPFKKVRKSSQSILYLNHKLQTDKKLCLFQGIKNFDELFKPEEEHILQHELFFRFIAAVALHENPNTAVIVFKNTHIGQYIKALPYEVIESLNIHLHFLFRDPRAVYRSQKRSVGSWGKPMAHNPAEVILEWGNLFKLWQYFQNKPAHWVGASTYEDLVQNHKQELTLLFERLKTKEIFAQESPIGKYQTKIPQTLWHLHKNISKPIQPTFKDQWRKELTSDEQLQISRLLISEMVWMGYTPTPETSTIWYRNFFTLGLRVRIILLQIKHCIYGSEIPPNVNE